MKYGRLGNMSLEISKLCFDALCKLCGYCASKCPEFAIKVI